MDTPNRSFSLRSMLVTVFLLSLAASHYYTSHRLHQAELELITLRGELGYLSIDDRTQFHAIATETGEEFTWRWRCFFPKGYRYSIHAASKGIPFRGVPSNAGVSAFSNVTVESDTEALLTARLRKSQDGNWLLTISSRAGGAQGQNIPDLQLNIPAEDLAWRETHSSILAGTLGDAKTQSKPVTEPIILHSFRRYLEDETLLDTGYVFWIEAK